MGKKNGPAGCDEGLSPRIAKKKRKAFLAASSAAVPCAKKEEKRDGKKRPRWSV